MGIIDDKIREYAAAGDRAAKNKAAYAIRKACRHWTAQHGAGGGHVATTVNDLEQEAERELTQYQPGWNVAAQSKAVGRAGNLKPLAPGYSHERRMYVAGGKQENPISASVLRDTALADAPPGTSAHQLITTMNDATWDGYARAGGPVAVMGNSQVLFFDKQERLEHMLVCLGGRLIRAKNNQLFSTPANSPFMYAMDGYGNLFARADNLGAEQFNHSSFNAGREVICAGMIGAQQGQLSFISNESGHYQPSRADLYSCVKKLLDAGVQMAFGGAVRTRVRVLGVGDWPAVTTPATAGFDQVAAAMHGAAPAAIPHPATYTRW
jgi:hypothetical protein